LSQRSWQSDAPKAQTVGSLLRENIREYENIVDTIVQRTREQERIVREWDIEMERLTERQYRMNYDDVVREFNHKVREYCIQK
jgi:phage terminase large subunit-like protein